MSDSWQEHQIYDRIGMLTNEERDYYTRQSQQAPDDEMMPLQGPIPPEGFHFNYSIHRTTFESHPALKHRFIQLEYDQSTHLFVIECFQQYKSLYRSGKFLLFCCIKPLLAKFYAHTDLNGILHTGQMFLVSTEQVKKLLNPNVVLEQMKRSLPSSDPLISYTADSPPVSSTSSSSRRRLLDVGAGDGRVTAQVAPLFDEVVCTEVSAKMCGRLKKRGYRVHNIGDLRELPSDGGYDVITLFNVMDRCNTPITLLKQIRSLLRSEDSRVLLATPLPLNPWVEKGLEWAIPAQNIRRQQAFKNRNYSWEESCGWLVDDLISRCGFVVQSVSKVPYISQGDNTRAFYLLHDALFVLAPMPGFITNAAANASRSSAESTVAV